MIKSFADADTKNIWNGKRSTTLPPHIQNTSRRKLRMINNASTILDLKVPPANRLKKLKGELNDFYSIRVNDQWRIIFKWRNNDAYKVKILDYHE